MLNLSLCLQTKQMESPLYHCYGDHVVYLSKKIALLTMSVVGYMDKQSYANGMAFPINNAMSHCSKIVYK